MIYFKNTIINMYILYGDTLTINQIKQEYEAFLKLLDMSLEKFPFNIKDTKKQLKIIKQKKEI
jgi:hypothetical protein